MMTGQIGWAVSNRIVYRTTDGGHNWTDVMPCGIPTRHALASFFLSANDAWLAVMGTNAPKFDIATPAGVTVFRTTNGGRTWQASRVPVQGSVEPFNRLTFANARDGWLWLNEGVAAGNAYYALLRTVDGGQHWTQTVSEEPYGRPARLVPAGFPSCDCATALTFRNVRVGWTTGSNLVPPVPFLWITHDGGYHWYHQSFQLPRGESFYHSFAPVFFGQSEGILPVQLVQGKSIDVFDAYLTHDGGMSWRSTTPLVLPEPAQRAPIPTFSFAGRLHGWVSSGWDLYRTSDGGRHWAHMHPHGSFNSITQLDFIDSHQGFAVEQFINGSFPTYLLATTDGGQSWRAVSSYSASLPLHLCR